MCACVHVCKCACVHTLSSEAITMSDNELQASKRRGDGLAVQQRGARQAMTTSGAVGVASPLLGKSVDQYCPLKTSPHSRLWLVSTSGEKIIVIYGDQRIEVLSNGSYDITQISSDMRSDEALNVDLLSRAIKHLTRFKL